MAEQRLSDEQFQEFLQLTILMSDRKGLFMWAADELAAYRAGEIAPDGYKLVRDDELANILRGPHFHPFSNCTHRCPLYPCEFAGNAMLYGSHHCRAALLTHYGLPEVPDAT